MATMFELQVNTSEAVRRWHPEGVRNFEMFVVETPAGWTVVMFYDGEYTDMETLTPLHGAILRWAKLPE